MESGPIIDGRYQILGELGRGNMGVVYLARDRSIGREVALKVILGTADAHDLERFRREAHAMASVQSPYIVKVHSVGLWDGRPYFAMGYVRGRSMEACLEALTFEDVARAVSQVAEGLEVCHRVGVLHRDIKPSNIIIDEEGGAHLTDFGLARVMDEKTLTRPGMMVGTLAYASPEQTRGQPKILTPATDIWSLGVILYRRLAGRLPFEGGTLLEAIHAIREARAPRPSQLRTGVPLDLESVCLRALAREPAARYASALELREDLERYLHGEKVRRKTPGGPTLAFALRVGIPVILFGLLAGGVARQILREDSGRESAGARASDPLAAAEHRRAAGDALRLAREALDDGQIGDARRGLEEARNSMEHLPAGGKDRLDLYPDLARVSAQLWRRTRKVEDAIGALQAVPGIEWPMIDEDIHLAWAEIRTQTERVLPIEDDCPPAARARLLLGLGEASSAAAVLLDTGVPESKEVLALRALAEARCGREAGISLAVRSGDADLLAAAKLALALALYRRMDHADRFAALLPVAAALAGCREATSMDAALLRAEGCKLLGHIFEAARALADAARLGAPPMEGAVRQGELLLVLGRRADARSVLDAVLDIPPGFCSAAKERARPLLDGAFEPLSGGEGAAALEGRVLKERVDRETALLEGPGGEWREDVIEPLLAHARVYQDLICPRSGDLPVIPPDVYDEEKARDLLARIGESSPGLAHGTAFVAGLARWIGISGTRAWPVEMEPGLLPLFEHATAALNLEPDALDYGQSLLALFLGPIDIDPIFVRLERILARHSHHRWYGLGFAYLIFLKAERAHTTLDERVEAVARLSEWLDTRPERPAAGYAIRAYLHFVDGRTGSMERDLAIARHLAPSLGIVPMTEALALLQASPPPPDHHEAALGKVEEARRMGVPKEWLLEHRLLRPQLWEPRPDLKERF